MGRVLFRAASRRTGHDGFPVIRLSSDYGVNGEAVSQWRPLRDVGELHSAVGEGDYRGRVAARVMLHCRVVGS
ncbi:hypothetical protein OHB49_44715 (plasmid) [Streptomyces sp. NBC_01717]|uniref:hypothetical protein n=1 Tax=Streptomyces sp. NBC_01717 TaxID=2975918 RepID=UPI002E37A28F|nr:hypothetical protein [Streptomyces sp. NBC_01717]